MKFGKEFRIHLEETLPEWRDKYLCYKPLKKLLKNIPPPDLPSNLPDGDHQAQGLPPQPSSPAAGQLHEWFVGILNEELDKFNDFYVDKEEDFIIRFQELKERIERVKEKGCRDGALASESEFSEEMMAIRRDFVAIHGEMVLLKNYSSLNFAGLIKILKKYDKRTGGLLRLPFTQLALHQPFFTTEPLTRLVRECEANLELLFPLEAEIVESTPLGQDQAGATSSTSNNAAESVSVGDENVDVYRSTLAAMRAIQSLKRASSTYNPFSLSSIFGNQDTESTGAVTAENSPSDSSAPEQNGEEAHQDLAGSPK